jgi:ATP-dependent RNA helicase DeaD
VSFPQASPALGRALAERNYTVPTPVQSAVLGADAEGRDVLVSAQTGSGKTVAYGLAIGPNLIGDAERLPYAISPLALVIAPTRELAIQVERELGWLYRDAGGRIVSCVGGMDARAERRKLAEGVHIVVGTPGRLRDHIERGALVLDGLKAVVLDEADEMLNMGFRKDLEFILDATPAERRTLMFSATVPRGIANLAQRFQKNALRLEVTTAEIGHADIEYRAIRVAPGEVEHVVVNMLRFVEAQTAIVFCNTRDSVRHLEATLAERGFQAVVLSGELSQNERNTSMQALRDGRARVCVATDVAARGLDLPNVGLVIHAEPPQDAEALQHRSGRTGRAGRKGISALLVPPARRRRIEQLLRDAGVRAEWAGPPTAEDVLALDRLRLLEDPLFTEPPAEADHEMARRLLQDHTPESLAALLVKVYRARLPALEDVTDPGHAPMRDAAGKKGRRERDRPDWQPVLNEPPPRRREFESRDNGFAGKREFEPNRSFDAPRPKLAPRADFGPATWFSLDVGRIKKADPKWILPMLCRKGDIERKDIGAIRIFDHETRIEIAEGVAETFATNFKRPGGEAYALERLPAGLDQPERLAPRAEGPRPAPRGKDHALRDFQDRDFKAKPFKDKPFKDRPFKDKPGESTPRDFKPRDGKPADFAGPRDGAKAKPAGKSKDFKPKDFKPKEGFKPKDGFKAKAAPGDTTPFRIRKKERKARARV